jgi:cytochrome c
MRCRSALDPRLGAALLAGIAALVAGTVSAGDAARGKTLYESRCIACHSLDANRVGPRHRGVYGRRAGAIADYDYSAALKGAKIVWTDEALERWLADPERVAPGQKMGYSIGERVDRDDVIAYLKSPAAR